MSEQINKNGTANGDFDPSLKSAINKISEADAYARLKKNEQDRRLKNSEGELKRNLEATERERELRELAARERAERELAARRYAEEYRKRLKAEGSDSPSAPKSAGSATPKSEPEGSGVRTADILKRAAEYRKRMKALYGTCENKDSDRFTEKEKDDVTPLIEEGAPASENPDGERCEDSQPESTEKKKIILTIEDGKQNDKVLYIPGEEFYGSNTPEVNHALAAVIGAYRANLKLEERREDSAYAREMEIAVKEGDAQRYSVAAEARLKFADETARRRHVLENEIAKVTKENPTLLSTLSAEEAKYERLLEESKRRKEEMRESYERQLKEAFGDKYAPRAAKGRDEEFREDVTLALKGADFSSDKRAIEEYEKHLESKFFAKEEKKLPDVERNNDKKSSANREYERSLEKKAYESLEEEFVPVKRGDQNAIREYDAAKKKDEQFAVGVYDRQQNSAALSEYERARSDESERDTQIERTKRDLLDEEAIRAYDKYNEKRESLAERRRRATGKGLTEDLMPIVEESFLAVSDKDTVFSGELITKATLKAYLRKVDATASSTERGIERTLARRAGLAPADLAALLLDVLAECRQMVKMHIECLKTLTSIERGGRRIKKYSARLSLAISIYNRTVDEFAECAGKALTKIPEQIINDITYKSASPTIPLVTYTIPAPVLKETAASRDRIARSGRARCAFKYTVNDMKRLRRLVNLRTDKSKVALSEGFDPRTLYERAEREMRCDLEMILLRTEFLKNFYGERLALEKYSFALTKEEHRQDIKALTHRFKLVSRERRRAIKLERADNLRYYTALCTSPSACKAKRQADRTALAGMHKSLSEMLLQRHSSNEELVKLYSQSADLFGERINRRANKKALAAAKAAHDAMMPTLDEIRGATAFDPHLAIAAMNKKIALTAQIAKEDWRAKKLNIKTTSHKNRMKQLREELKKTESTIRSYVRRARSNPRWALIIAIAVTAAALAVLAGVAILQWDNILAFFSRPSALLSSDNLFHC